MNKQNQNTAKKDGFTIIEVVLVLAIAGLIFLMVFIALPNLQRGQRDTQRKSDLARMSTQISNYQSSNRGKLPGGTIPGAFVTNYLNGTASNTAGAEYSDPSRGNYVLKGNVTGTTTSTPPSGTSVNGDPGVIYYSEGYTCDDSGTGDVVSGTSRNFALRIALEATKAPYCLDNR